MLRLIKRFNWKRVIPIILVVLLVFSFSVTSIFASDPIEPVKDKPTVEVTDKNGAVPFDKQLKERKIGDKIRLDTNTVSQLTKVGIKDGKTVQTWEVKISGLPQTMNDLVTPLNTDWVNQQDGSIKTGNNLFEAVVTGSTVKVTYKGSSQTWTPKVMVGLNEDIPSIPCITKDLINPNYNVNTIVWYYTNCTRYLRVIEGSIQESYVFYRNPNDNVQIFDNIYKDAGFNYREIPIAFDVYGKGIQLSGDKGISKTEFNRTDITYPITIDPTASFTTSASDGYTTNGINAVYNTGWSYTSAPGINTTSTYENIGQSFASSYYSIYRDGLYFDTSSLGSLVTITGATLNLYGSTDLSVIDFDITVQTGGGTYPHDPMVVADYNKANYSDNGGTLNTSGFSTVGYNTINLNATGYGWINQTGTTKFALRSSLDIAGTAPIGNEYVVVYAYEKGLGHQPYLTVTYTVSAPSITAIAASLPATTSSRLNSQIISDGGDVGVCTVKFGYGTTSYLDPADFNSYTTKTSVTIPTSVYSTNNFPYLDVTGLTETTPYYYRVQVTNANSTVTSTNEITFTTDTTVVNPTNIQASPLSTSISLNWSKGSGASKTLIRYRTDHYPTTTADGTSIYLDTGATYIHTGLALGTTYYYSFWGEDATVYSASYLSIAMTTSAARVVSTGFSAITDPSNYNMSSGEIDTKVGLLSNLGPFYDLTNGFVDSWGMQRGNAWAGIVAFIISILGLIVYIKSGSISGALVVVVVCMVIGYFIGIVSGWWILFGILGMLGSFALPKRET